MLKKLLLFLFLMNLPLGASSAEDSLATEIYKSPPQNFYLSVDFLQCNSVEKFTPDTTLIIPEDEWLKLTALARTPWTGNRSKEMLKLPSCSKIAKDLKDPLKKTLRLEAPNQLTETIVRIDRHTRSLVSYRDNMLFGRTEISRKDIPAVHCSIISTSHEAPMPLVECFKTIIPSAPWSTGQSILGLLACGAAVVLINLLSSKSTTI